MSENSILHRLAPLHVITRDDRESCRLSFALPRGPQPQSLPAPVSGMDPLSAPDLSAGGRAGRPSVVDPRLTADAAAESQAPPRGEAEGARQWWHFSQQQSLGATLAAGTARASHVDGSADDGDGRDPARVQDENFCSIFIHFLQTFKHTDPEDDWMAEEEEDGSGQGGGHGGGGRASVIADLPRDIAGAPLESEVDAAWRTQEDVEWWTRPFRKRTEPS